MLSNRLARFVINYLHSYILKLPFTLIRLLKKSCMGNVARRPYVNSLLLGFGKQMGKRLNIDLAKLEASVPDLFYGNRLLNLKIDQFSVLTRQQYETNSFHIIFHCNNL
jgi:hypothetical protein